MDISFELIISTIAFAHTVGEWHRFNWSNEKPVHIIRTMEK